MKLNEEVTIRETIAQIALDNLAAHSLFGFSEAFSGGGTYASRYCTCTGSDMQLKVSIYFFSFFFLSIMMDADQYYKKYKIKRCQTQ